MVDDLSKLGIGLSRVLRYSYPSILIIVLMWLFEPDKTRNMLESLGKTEFLAIFILIVIGAGFYVLYRSIIIPLHHLLFIGFHRFEEKCRGITRKDTMNPVIYLREELKVSLGWGMIAYSYLRQSDFFKQKKEIDIKHAEASLLVMTIVGLFAGGIYDKFIRTQPKGYFWFMVVLSMVFFVSSLLYSRVTHSLECQEMRKRKEIVKDKLQEANIISNS